MSSRILESHIRGPIDREGLVAALVDILGLDPDELSLLSEARQTPVCLDWVVRDGGFRTWIALYMDEEVAPAVSDDEALAERLAKHLMQDVAADPGSHSAAPWAWLLVRPDGTRFIASEIARDDDILELDERPEKLTAVNS